jgi:hypothetical protein
MRRLSRIHHNSFNHRQSSFGCCFETLKHSLWQVLAIRLWLTRPPFFFSIIPKFYHKNLTGFPWGRSSSQKKFAQDGHSLGTASKNLRKKRDKLISANPLILLMPGAGLEPLYILRKGDKKRLSENQLTP